LNIIIVVHTGASSWLSGLNLGTRVPLSLGFGNGGKGQVIYHSCLGGNLNSQNP